MLYNCPSLESACIGPELTRLPLLYVQSSSDASASENLHRLTQQVVQECIFGNQETAKPLLVEFQGLEVDGNRNEVLHCIGKPETPGTRRLQLLVEILQQRIQTELKYTCLLPPDRPQTLGKDETHPPQNNPSVWRPRIPFMRLPPEFLDEDDISFRSADDGGNGISPILWYKWWNDEFSKGEGVRMRQLAIYPRSLIQPSLDEQAFSTVQCTIALPSAEGYDALLRFEESQRAYMNSREKPDKSLPSTSTLNTFMPTLSGDDPNPNISLTSSQNMSLDQKTILFNQESDSDVVPAVMAKSVIQPTGGISTFVKSSAPTEFQQQGDQVDTRSDEAKAKKPWPNEPLIAKFKRLQGLKATPSFPSSKSKSVPKPPYPAREHFQGVWRFVATPGNDEDSMDSRDNLILRVDGSVAGGPILESQTKQKAAGGSWKLYQAEYVGNDETDSLLYKDKIKTRLQIRLLIPPAKTKELWLDGEVTRIMMPNAQSKLSSTFNLLDLSAIVDSTYQNGEYNSAEQSQEALLHCEGEAWIQTIEQPQDRSKLGSFALIKLSTLDMSKLHYTVQIPK